MSVSVPLPALNLPVIVTFLTTDVGVSFLCQLDGRAWVTCSSPMTISGLSSGKHRIQVRTIDGSGVKSDVARSQFTV